MSRDHFFTMPSQFVLLGSRVYHRLSHQRASQDLGSAQASFPLSTSFGSDRLLATFKRLAAKLPIRMSSSPLTFFPHSSLSSFSYISVYSQSPSPVPEGATAPDQRGENPEGVTPAVGVSDVTSSTKCPDASMVEHHRSTGGVSPRRETLSSRHKRHKLLLLKSGEPVTRFHLEIVRQASAYHIDPELSKHFFDDTGLSRKEFDRLAAKRPLLYSTEGATAFHLQLEWMDFNRIADTLGTAQGCGFLLQNEFFPVSHHLLVANDMGHWYLLPCLCTPACILKRMHDRHIPIDYKVVERYFDECLHYEHQCLAAVRADVLVNSRLLKSLSEGVKEMLLVMAGVEQNPGPSSGKGGGAPGSKASRKAQRKESTRQSQEAARERESANYTAAEEDVADGKHAEDPVMAKLEKDYESLKKKYTELKDKEKKEVVRYVQEFRVGQQFVLRKRLEYDGSMHFSEVSNPEEYFRAEVAKVNNDLSVEFRVTKNPYCDVHTVVLKPEELEVGRKAAIFTDTQVSFNNVMGGLARSGVHHMNSQFTVTCALVLLAIAEPHPGYMFTTMEHLNISFMRVPYQVDYNGCLIDRERLEQENFVFFDTWDYVHDKQLRGIHVAPLSYDVTLYVPDYGDPVTQCSGIGKRLCPDKLPARDSKYLSEKLSFASDALISYVLKQDPEVDTAEEILQKFLEGRTASECKLAYQVWDEYVLDPDRLRRLYLSTPVDYFIKLELYTGPKPPRYIASRDFKLRVMQCHDMGVVLQFLERALKKANVKGLNPQEIRTKITDKYDEVCRCLETDFSSFEANLTKDVRDLIENKIFRAVAEHLQIADAEFMIEANSIPYWKVVCQSGGWRNDKFPTIRFSGDLWTSIGNQVSNIAITYAIIYEILRRHGVYLTMDDYLDGGLFEGDDGIINAEWISKEEFDAEAKRLGFLLEVDEGPWTDLSFCGNQMEELSDGRLIRAQDLEKVAAKLSVIFTNLPRDPRSDREYLSLQRAKATSMLVLSDIWVPDCFVLALLIEGATRNVRISEKVFRSAYGRLSEWNPFHAEGCLEEHPDPVVRKLMSLVPGSDGWFHELMVGNAEGTFTLEEIHSMWDQLTSAESLYCAKIPRGFENDSIFMNDVIPKTHLPQISRFETQKGVLVDELVTKYQCWLRGASKRSPEQMRLRAIVHHNVRKIGDGDLDEFRHRWLTFFKVLPLVCLVWSVPLTICGYNVIGAQAAIGWVSIHMIVLPYLLPEKLISLYSLWVKFRLWAQLTIDVCAPADVG